MSGEASTSIRILFVDDSKVMLKTASKILSAEFDVVTAIDGVDAWAKLENDHDIQVLFTDINMPRADGYALLKNVRTSDDSGLSNMPVILVTGADDDDDARQVALDRGATDFLNKKYIGTELLTRARAHAKYQRISRQLQAQTTLDPMTGLVNEHGFLDRLEQDIAYAHRHQHALTLIRVEIDHLVALYEARGNQVVEPIVVHVANLIRSRIRKEDTAAHIGLGGFAISVPGGEPRGVEAMAEWLRAQAAAMAIEVDGLRLSVSLSMAVINEEAEAWISARDALTRSHAALDHMRQQVAIQAAERKRQQAEAQAVAEHARQEAEARAITEHARLRAEEQVALEHARQQAEAQAEGERVRQAAEAQAAAERERQQAQTKAAAERERQQAEAQVAAERARQRAEAKAAQKAARKAARKATRPSQQTKPGKKAAAAKIMAPEPTAAQAKPKQVPTQIPALRQPEVPQAPPKPDLVPYAARGDAKQVPVLQRVGSFLRSQWARFIRFLRKPIGK